MATSVFIPRRHRADFDAAKNQAVFSFYTSVVDLQPNEGDLEGASLEGAAQCACCSLHTFLGAIPNLEAYSGLFEVRKVFPHMIGLQHAVRTGQGDFVQSTAQKLGARACFELITADSRPRLHGVPKIRIIRQNKVTRREVTHATEINKDDWVLVEPNEHGPAWVLRQVQRAVSFGCKRFLVGFVEHATAAERWSAFYERADFAEGWQRLLEEAAARDVEQLSFVMAFPACATLQWKKNLPLEGLRARLDLQFRSMEAQASMMCPENVSGYGLVNDMRELGSQLKARRQNLAVRCDAVLLSF